MRRLTVLTLAAFLLLAWGVGAAPHQQSNLFQLFILQARQDIEILANEVLGEGIRPETWTGNSNLESQAIVPDLWFDNEQLADAVFGASQRPVEWFGATSTDIELIARNVRHDLELSADEVFGRNVRPDAWNGADLIYQCSRTVQNMTRLLDRIYNTRPQVPAGVLNYCASVTSQIESELLPVVFESETIGDEQLPALIVALRGDLERLSNETLGLDNRPDGWLGYIETSDTLLRDSAADLDLLVINLLGNERPDGWDSSFASNNDLLYRTARRNLEVLANMRLGTGVRPNGWQGEDPLEQCPVIEQGLVFIVQANYSFMPDEALLESSNFCNLVSFTANSIAENPAALAEADAEELESRYLGESEYAFSYLDQAAIQYMGIMPAGTVFRAWYRNFNESSMMFVSGEDFALYIDRRWTTLAEEVFNTLPTLEGVIPLAFCDARWCNGPSPTPTPTGGGPLLNLLNATTPQPTLDPGNIAGQDGNKRQVSWNHIRVTYLLDRSDTGTAQVALEICAEPAQIACEPVTSVFDNSLGTPKPVISSFNGLNVYEFRYGYNNTVVVEGANFVSPDIWISDPTIRG